MECLEKERRRLEEENLSREREAARFRQRLDKEKQDRSELERMTTELVRNMKEKWKAEANSRIETLNERIKVRS